MDRTLVTKYNLKNLLYYMVFIGGIACNMFGFIFDCLSYGFQIPYIIYILSGVYFLIVGIAGLVSGKTNIAIYAMFVIIDIVELPFVFYVFGLNALVYLLLGLVCNVIFLTGKGRIVLTILTILCDIGAVIIYKLVPESFIEFDGNRFAPAIVSFVVVAITLCIMSAVLISQYNHEKARNKQLQERLNSYTKRDMLTNAFNKKYANEYLEAMMEEKEEFVVAAYKISSYERLKSKFGTNFCNVGLISLSEIILNHTALSAFVARYSESTFLIIFNDTETAEVKQTLYDINDEISNGISKTMDIKYTSVVVRPDKLINVINSLSIRVGGFGDDYES